MRCNVPFCISEAPIHNRCKGISFFSFPKDPKIRKAWTKALGTNSVANTSNFICSNHFREVDIYETTDGIRKLHDGALPVKILDCDALAALRVCRICLALDCKMYDFAEFDQMFEQITGILTTEEESTRLPQRLCWECAARLKAAAAFRDKAFISDGLLHDLLKTCTQIKIRDVKTINRVNNGLKTNLVQNVYDCEHYELNIKDTFVETVHDSDSDTEIQNDDKVEILETNNPKDKLNVVVEMPPKDITSTNNINEQDSNVDMLFEEFDHSDDSDTEVIKKKKKTEAELKAGGTGWHVIEVNEPVDKNMYVTKIPVIKNNPNENIFEDYHSEDEVDFKDEVGLETQEEITAGGSNNEIVKVYEHVNINKYVTKLPANTVKKGKSGVQYHRLSKKEIQPIDEDIFEITSLSYEEQMNEFKARKESAWYKKAPYKCTVCYKAFVFKDSYNSHVYRHNQKNGAYECYICTMRLKTAQSLRTHLLGRHTVQYNCKLCKFRTRYRNAVLTHTRFHQGKKYKCSFCPKEFDMPSTYFGHLRFKHMFDLVCHLCGYTFVSNNGLSQHKKRMHRVIDEATPLEGPHCDVCNITFLSQEAYDTHLKVSSKHLHEQDPTRIRNERNIRNPTGTNIHAARGSIEQLREPRRFNRFKTRGPNKPVICEQCGTELRTFKSYVLHFEREHPDMTMTQKQRFNVSPVMCEQCGKIVNKPNLKTHMLVHSRQQGLQMFRPLCVKKFICDYCARAFAAKPSLEYHMRVHDPTLKLETHQCPTCHKELSSSSNLIKHLLVHSNLKPFQCEMCEKHFKTSHECRAHTQHVHLLKPWPRKKKRTHGTVESVED